VATPDTQFTVADFQRLAREAIAGIRGRGNLSFLVGGTGLYIEAVLYNFSLRALADPAQRARLQKFSVEELQNLLFERGIALPENERNPRYLVRTLETEGVDPRRTPLQPNALIIGLDPGREVLRQKITQRVDVMVEAGFIDEVRQLAARYGWDAPGLKAPGYKAFRPYVEGEIPLEEAKRLFVQNDMQYAKRQKTWFKRNKDIHWISKTAKAVELVTTILNK
jgi:tRNA dimethylallyltransferase